MVKANGNDGLLGHGVNGHYPPIPPELLDPTGVMDGKAILPGHDGLPFRGPVPHLKEDDPDFRQPQIGMRMHVRVFDLSESKDMLYYEQVWQLVANGFATISNEDKQYDESKKNWRIFLRWVDLFTHVKQEA